MRYLLEPDPEPEQKKSGAGHPDSRLIPNNLPD